jgi:hypothetical protein
MKRTRFIAEQDKYVFVSFRAAFINSPVDLLQDIPEILLATVPSDDHRYLIVRQETFPASPNSMESKRAIVAFNVNSFVTIAHYKLNKAVISIYYPATKIR